MDGVDKVDSMDTLDDAVDDKLDIVEPTKHDLRICYQQSTINAKM